MSSVFIGMGTCGLATGAKKVETAVSAWADKTGREITIIPTGCVGYCQVEPIMDIVTEEGIRLSYGNVTEKNVEALLDSVLVNRNYGTENLLGQYKNGQAAIPELPFINEHPFFKKQVKYVLRNCGVINPESLLDYKAQGGFKGLERALKLSQKEVIEEVLEYGLRGRGGAGFPTGKKWEFAYVNEADKKYVICNADEGDPGAFMDRSLMEGDPFSLIEGMMIAGYAIGADEGVIYCRAESPIAIQRLSHAIEPMKQAGLLDKPLSGAFTF